MSTKEVLVRRECPDCKGKDVICCKCNNEKYVEEWVPIALFINEIKSIIKRDIDRH